MTKRIQKIAANEKGFTLVELAVVMIIIGLLVGGVLKGQQMIANAEVTSTVAQVKAIDSATTTFRDMYDAFPGDMTTATTRLSGCTGVCVNATGGNAGNGHLDVSPTAAQTAANENANMYRHLAAADLLGGTSSTAASPWIEGNIRGTFFVAGWTAGGTLGMNTAVRQGHYLGLVNTVAASGTVTATANTAGTALTPLEAARIDRKIDDGIPTTGSAFATGGSTCGTATGYIERTDTKICSMVVRFNG